MKEKTNIFSKIKKDTNIVIQELKNDITKEITGKITSYWIEKELIKKLKFEAIRRNQTLVFLLNHLVDRVEEDNFNIEDMLQYSESRYKKSLKYSQDNYEKYSIFINSQNLKKIKKIAVDFNINNSDVIQIILKRL